MKNFVQKGDILTLIATENTLSGDVVVIGDIVGVAITNAPSGSKVSVATTGVYMLRKEPGAIEQGEKVYWKSDKGVTKDATEAKYLGVCVLTTEATETETMVRLGGSV